MTKQATPAQEAHVRSLTEMWILFIQDGHLPIAVAYVPDTPVLAVSCNPHTGDATLFELNTAFCAIEVPCSAAISTAAAVSSHCMAGYVWEEHIHLLPPKAQRAYEIVTRKYRNGLSPAKGTKVARKLLGER